MKISVVINTYNADRCLEKVLQSVQDYDEVIICDMHSTDRTIEIAEKYNCKIFYHEHTGIVEPARKYAISQATHDWVLVVDADEAMQAPLKDYLIQTVKENPDIAAIRLPRLNYFMGRLMHANYPDYITRFVKKDSVEWPSRIHTRPIIDGQIFWVPTKRKDVAFVHDGFPSINHKLEKTCRYTSFEATRETNKVGFWGLVFKPFARFFRCYIMKGGFRDGLPGLIWAADAAIYKFYSVSKAIENRHTQNKDKYDDTLKKYFD